LCLDFYLQPSKKKFDFFLSHDWGAENKNHLKVKEFAAILKKNKEVTVWIDDERNKGNMRLTIAEAIKNSRFFIAFLTKSYNRKIERGPRAKEWCFYEFNYATYIMAPSNLILISFEKDMHERGSWCTYLQAAFANQLYYDLSEVDKSTAWKKFVSEVTEERARVIEEELTKMQETEETENQKFTSQHEFLGDLNTVSISLSGLFRFCTMFPFSLV
jgi:hypothetical protein